MLNRITPKTFTKIGGLDEQQARIDPTMSRSNVYSIAETILLKWVRSHNVNVDPSFVASNVYMFDKHFMDG